MILNNCVRLREIHLIQLSVQLCLMKIDFLLETWIWFEELISKFGLEHAFWKTENVENWCYFVCLKLTENELFCRSKRLKFYLHPWVFEENISRSNFFVLTFGSSPLNLTCKGFVLSPRVRPSQAFINCSQSWTDAQWINACSFSGR